jgi:hypothetical protein
VIGVGPWSFVHVCDTQPGSPRSFRFRPADLENQQTAYAQIRALAPDLVLVGGDLTRDGSIHGFELAEARANLDALGLPYRAIPGNMDTGNKHAPRPGALPNRDDLALNVTSAQLTAFARHFGEFPWTFVHKNVRFTGIYAAVAGSGLPEETRLWEFLDALPQLPRAAHHVAMTHYPLFVDQMDEPNFDIADPDQYFDWYFCIDHPHRDRIAARFKAAGVGVVFSGHIHCRRPPQTVDGIRFYQSAATSFGQWADRFPDGDTTRGFYAAAVSDEEIDCRFVPLLSVSARTDGYGPGGHPRPEERDYSLAWEQPPPEVGERWPVR